MSRTPDPDDDSPYHLATLMEQHLQCLLRGDRLASDGTDIDHLETLMDHLETRFDDPADAVTWYARTPAPTFRYLTPADLVRAGLAGLLVCILETGQRPAEIAMTEPASHRSGAT